MGAGAILVLRKRTVAATFGAAVAVGLGSLFVFLIFLGFFRVSSVRGGPGPQLSTQVAVASPPKVQSSEFLAPAESRSVEAGPKSDHSPATVPSAASGPRAQSSTDAPRQQTTSSGDADAPMESGPPRAPSPSSSEPPKTEAEAPATDGSSAKQSDGPSSDEHQDQQALGELRRRIFERVVVALREIIAEEMPAEGGNSAESAIDSAISAAIDQRPMAEKPLPPPASRPDWLSAAGSGGSPSSVVVVGPYVDVAECERHLYEAVQPVVAEFVTNYLGPEWRDRLTLPEEFVRTELIRDRYVETVPASFGPMVQLHLLLSFDGKVKAQLAAQQLEILQRQRVGAIGTVFGCFLGCMAIAYFALRRDLACGGRRRSSTIAWSGTSAGLCIVLTAAAMRYLVF